MSERELGYDRDASSVDGPSDVVGDDVVEGGVDGVVEGTDVQATHRERLVQAGELLAGVVHEIKNPLAVIQGYAQLLHDKVTDDEDRSDLQCILEETRRVGGLIDDMLSFTRRGAEAVENVDLGRVVSSAINLTSHSMRQGNISLVASLPEAPVYVRGHHGAYVQVLLNLLSNARQSLEAGRPAGRGIAIRLESEGACTAMVVSNNGPAVPDALVESIFDPFVTTKADGEGTGLGLSVSRQILGRYGASIELDRAVRDGVSFRVGLPNAAS